MKTLLTMTAAAALFAAPAFAQSDDAADNGQPAGETQDMTTGDSATEGVAASQEKVRAILSDAGLTDVAILDTAYVVQATTPDGERVLMIIDSSGRVIGAQPAPAPSGGAISDDGQMKSDMKDTGETDAESGSETE